MKKCFKCRIEQPFDNFYKHKKMSDGYLGKCKSCTKKDTANNVKIHKQNPEWVEKERNRTRLKYYRIGCKKPNKEIKQRSIDTYKNNYPEKFRAKIACQHLKKINKENHLHHWSYNEEHYQDVIEISKKDHYLAHRYMVYDQEFKMYRNLNNWLLDSKSEHLEYLKSLGINVLHPTNSIL